MKLSNNLDDNKDKFCLAKEGLESGLKDNPLLEESQIGSEITTLVKQNFLSMTDFYEPEIRSYNMSRIQSKDTKPELLVRKFLFKNEFRHRLHVKDLPGKMDHLIPI